MSYTFTQLRSHMYNDALRLSPSGVAGGFDRDCVKYEGIGWDGTTVSWYVGLFDPLIYSEVALALS